MMDHLPNHSTCMIHKLVLEQAKMDVQLPYSMEFLSVGHQDGLPVCWYQFNTLDDRKWRYSVTIVGTGHPHPADIGGFLGTVQMPNGLVWHVFTRRWAQ